MNGSNAGAKIGMREIFPHVAVLALVLICVQLPRAGGLPARLAAPVFSANRGFLDFDLGYYPAGEAIRNHPDTLYRGAEYNEATGELSITAQANFVNLPLVAWLFAPFTLLSPPQAGIALLILNTILALASLFLLLRIRNVSNRGLRWAITLVFAASGPLLNALNMGQTSPLVLFLLILLESELQRSRRIAAGIWLGLIGLIKVPPLLLLPYFALRRQWSVVLAATAVLGGTTLLSILCYGWALHVEYFNLVFRANFGNAIAAHNCQSISSFVARAFTEASLLSWQPIRLGGLLRLAPGLFQAAVLVLAARAAWRQQTPANGIGLFLAAALLVSPVTWAHYGIWLIPALAFVAEERAGELTLRRWWPVILVWLLISLPVLPVSIVRNLEMVRWFRIAVSHLFFGTLLLFVLLLSRHQTAAEPEPCRSTPA